MLTSDSFGLIHTYNDWNNIRILSKLVIDAITSTNYFSFNNHIISFLINRSLIFNSWHCKQNQLVLFLWDSLSRGWFLLQVYWIWVGANEAETIAGWRLFLVRPSRSLSAAQGKLDRYDHPSILLHLRVVRLFSSRNLSFLELTDKMTFSRRGFFQLYCIKNNSIEEAKPSPNTTS